MKRNGKSGLRWVLAAALFSPVACGRAEPVSNDGFNQIEPIDAGGPPPTCGDGTCGPGETLINCADDCRCGDGVCSRGESCPADCAGKCGNGVCDPNESHASCAADCPNGT